MTTITTTSPTSARTATTAGVAVAIVASVLSTLFAHEAREAMVNAATLVVVAAGVFGFVVPRALRKESAGGTALTLGIVAALLVVPAYWSGLPCVFGVAAVLVGNTGRTARAGAGTSIVGLVLGALATLACLASYLSDGLAGNMGFLFA
jgi:hypothetical protein